MMDITMFHKMKATPGLSARVLHAPEDYPKWPDLDWASTGTAGFVHLFLRGRDSFDTLFDEAAALTGDASLFWISYPKTSAGKRADINRDSLWDLLLLKGWHPVAQVSLDETWSAVRVKPNEPGKAYVRPGAPKPTA